MAELYKILKERREAKGLTSAEIASQLGLSERMYNYYETGEKKPKLQNIIKLSEILNFDLNNLNEIKVPHETIPKLNGEAINITIANLVKANIALAEAQLVQADANKIQAEANLKHSIVTELLAASNNKLIAGSPPTEHDIEERFAAYETMLGNVLELLPEVATGKRYANRDEVLASLYRGGPEIEKVSASKGIQKS